MKSIANFAAASALFLGLSSAQNNTFDPTSQENATVCATGAHIIVARASTELPGYGIIGVVKNALLQEIPNSNAIAVPYPATINIGGMDGTPLYTESEPDGVGNMTQLIKQYGDACPDGRIVLLGYSQGAHVVGDVLLGTDLFPGESSAPLDERYLRQITAAVLMGDPAFEVGQPVDVGNATNGGLFERKNSTWAERGLADKVRSYCDADDLFCDRGQSLEVHTGYVPEYGNQSVEFVVSKFNTTSGDGAAASPSASATVPTGTASTPSGSATTPSESQFTGGVSSLSIEFTSTLLMGVVGAVCAFAL